MCGRGTWGDEEKSSVLTARGRDSETSFGVCLSGNPNLWGTDSGSDRVNQRKEQLNSVYKQTYKQLQMNSRRDTHQLQTENRTEKGVEGTRAEFRENLGKLGGSVFGEVAWEPQP